MSMTPIEIRAAIRQARVALPPLTSRADSDTSAAKTLIDEQYRLLLRKYERQKAAREAAFARAAEEHYAAGNRHARMPVFAAAWDQKPERPVVW